MIGAILGDITGSPYEFNNIKTKNFPFINGMMDRYTDDTILTMATARWILDGMKDDLGMTYARFAVADIDKGFGGTFYHWALEAVRNGKCEPYGSFGNGSAMRVSPVGWAFDSEKDVLKYAKITAEVTHNHEEGIKGAQAIALCIYLARTGSNKDKIRKTVIDKFGYDIDFTIKEIRPRYSWKGVDGKGIGVSCQHSVPQAIVSFLEGTDYVDTVRNAISIGGDSDTIACMAGGIAEAFYAVPKALSDYAVSKLRDDYVEILTEFEGKYGNRII